MREWSERHIRDVIRSELIKLSGGGSNTTAEVERSEKNGKRFKYTPKRDDQIIQ